MSTSKGIPEHVFMFQERFVAPILWGHKIHTMRPRRARQVRVGDVLSLRIWTRRPYHSPQKILMRAPCTRVADVRIKPGFIYIDGILLKNLQDLILFARADGFSDPTSLFDWFRKTHGPEFEGALFQWGKRIEPTP